MRPCIRWANDCVCARPHARARANIRARGGARRHRVPSRGPWAYRFALLRNWKALLTCLPVARVAIGQALHLVFLPQLKSESKLIRGRFIERIKHFGTRPEVFFGSHMAIQTPA